jgi:hypothetical protein
MAGIQQLAVEGSRMFTEKLTSPGLEFVRIGAQPSAPIRACMAARLNAANAIVRSF